MPLKLILLIRQTYPEKDIEWKQQIFQTTTDFRPIFSPSASTHCLQAAKYMYDD